ncbi:hypothetical protein FHR75_000002 [Kineococcus radiotolerans]|uniref:PAS fold-4 domain-containing protein n=1 Tax=Kineococcus radiotolerans TaxID=131568 RepID=A0A7W4THV4_KINRA|nr:PAS domain-containing protein [Kineococcus radiotolerans]MBB2899214.1 hypothetical protein [Kineococcus radiotolerans]
MAGTTHVDFGAVFDAVLTPYLVLDTDLTIVAVDTAYLHATTRSRGDLLGRFVFDAFPDNPDDPGAWATTSLSASLHRVLETARPDTMPLQKYDVPAAGGGFLRRWWSPVNAPVLDETGQVLLILHRVEDVTDYVDGQLRGDTASDASALDPVAGMAAGSALRTARTDLRRAESDLYVRGQELRAAVEAACRSAAQQTALVDIARSLGEAQDEGTVLAAIAEHSISLVGVSGSALCLGEPDGASPASVPVPQQWTRTTPRTVRRYSQT